MGKVGASELIVILLIVLIIFGPKQLPKLGRMLGKTISGFKQGMDEETESMEADSAGAVKAGTASTQEKKTETVQSSEPK